MKPKTVEEQWQEFATAVGIPMGGIQWTETRRAFYAGAIAMFGSVRCLDGPDDECVLQLERWSQELQQWAKGVGRGGR